jgi:hypothetical protein
MHCFFFFADDLVGSGGLVTEYRKFPQNRFGSGVGICRMFVLHTDRLRSQPPQGGVATAVRAQHCHRA